MLASSGKMVPGRLVGRIRSQSMALFLRLSTQVGEDLIRGFMNRRRKCKGFFLFFQKSRMNSWGGIHYTCQLFNENLFIDVLQWSLRDADAYLLRPLFLFFSFSFNNFRVSYTLCRFFRVMFMRHMCWYWCQGRDTGTHFHSGKIK